MTGTAWQHQREALRAIVPGPRLGTAVSRLSEEGADREAPARARGGAAAREGER